MNEETCRRAGQIADGLAWVCAELDSLNAVMPDKKTSPLRHLLAAVRNGQDPADQLQALHIALRKAGDQLGVWGHLRTGPLTGVDEQRPFEPVYLCPLGRCSGRQVDSATTFPLTCAITGRQLRRDQL
ncbi:hypothetical protein Ssi03_68430 [Sphaerisporangium siamense]|uniref:Uncharacterized protein n=1 Tax=Sphaerisporangium siamense TaxID=795645 RepID=A0A7W7D5I4_9ACTN|nr:hypothetical protein [Sphaerisporangium siamense]MBB4700618.1 hypothetical protein [Sphaerisporangium siamense]GII88853.1 hypothetical protein Ssi03_68430 [Sphaerisporangium siamense]